MSDQRNPSGKPQAQDKPQPWHEADEKNPAAKNSGGPIGTHSLTGGSANVGLPSTRKPEPEVERGEASKGEDSPDLMKEPRANLAEILGRKP